MDEIEVSSDSSDSLSENNENMKTITTLIDHMAAIQTIIDKYRAGQQYSFLELIERISNFCKVIWNTTSIEEGELIMGNMTFHVLEQFISIISNSVN